MDTQVENRQRLPNAPNTKLPFYDLKARGHDSIVSAPSHFYKNTITASPILPSTEAILQGFAAFVSAVTELEELAFVAQYAVDGVAERRLATATVTGLDKPRTFSSQNVQVATFKSSAIDGAEFDFEIKIGPQLDAPLHTTPRVSTPHHHL